MRETEVIRLRADKLAKQVFGFEYRDETHELVLTRYEYQERLELSRPFVIIKQWRRNTSEIFQGGITLNKITLDDSIKSAAIKLFTKDIRVVKIASDYKGNVYESQVPRNKGSKRNKIS